MLKSRPLPWVLSNCIRRSRGGPANGQRRRLSAALGTSPTACRTDGHDDALLRQMFDSRTAWEGFSRTDGLVCEKTGLFRNAWLTDRHGFDVFARMALRRARRIVAKVLAASSLAEYRVIVRDLDQLSDLLCRVLDLADFVRSAHPDVKVQESASSAWAMAYTYMNELNTTTGLHDQLVKAMENAAIWATWSEEERAVAEVLRLDFAKWAVNLPKEARERFVALSSEIDETGQQFMERMVPAVPWVRDRKGLFAGLDPVEAKRLTKRGTITIDMHTPAVSLALRSVHDSDVRRRLFVASRAADAGAIEKLEKLLSLRAELARLSGFPTYGHLALRDRMMAGSPEAVTEFLRALAGHNRPMVMQEMEKLLSAKKQLDPSATSLDAWDRDYLANRVSQGMGSHVKRSHSLSAFFSLGTVVQGISRICTRLYGIRFVPRQPWPGETWHEDVRPLDVISDTDGHVAVLYCDLFHRPSKFMNAAHFTVRCSRVMSQEEIHDVMTEAQDVEAGDRPQFATPEAAANDGMALSSKDGVLRQLPTIALVCDFPQRSDGKPVLLSFFQVETLFHEMGHALHSVLARTAFQNVAGTRCATDLAELPSTLMEYFAADASALALWARHHETDEPLPYDMLAEHLRAARPFPATDTEHQVVLAVLDQELHALPSSSVDHVDSTAVFHRVQRAWAAAPPDPPETSWQGFFGHLSGYGSTYYSYMFDRVLAERVWRVVFAAGQGGQALARENGEHLRETLLRWGGGRDPWRCLAATLRDDRLVDGGPAAMAVVGTWGMGFESLRSAASQ